MNVIGGELLAEVLLAEAPNAGAEKNQKKERARYRLDNRMRLWPDATRSSRWEGYYIKSIPGVQARFKREGQAVSIAVSRARKVIKQGIADRTLSVTDVGVQFGVLRDAMRDAVNLSIWATEQVLDKTHPVLAAYRAQLDKLASGEWKKVPWARPTYGHRALEHLSEEDPTRVAYTQSVEKLMRNLQTVTSPGKFLKQFHPGMEDAEIKRWAEITVANAAPWALNILNNNDSQWVGQDVELEDEWQRLYAEVSVDYSCMRGKRYVRPYGKPGNHLGLAYLSRGGDLRGRCIVRLDNMEYLRAFPGDEVSVSLVEGMLEAARFVRCDNGLEGIRLSRIQGNEQAMMMPYIDGDCQNFEIYENHILITDDGEYEASSQDGGYGGDEEDDDREECDDCHDMTDRADMNYVERHDRNVCPDCLDSNYYHAIVGMGRLYGYIRDYVRQEDCTYVGGVVGDQVADSELGTLDIYECEESGDCFHIDDLVSVMEGYCRDSQVVSLKFPDSEGNDYALRGSVKTTVFGNDVHEDVWVATIGGGAVHPKEIRDYPLAKLLTPINGSLYVTLDELKENMGGAESLCLTLGEHDEIEDLFAEIRGEVLEELKLWMNIETAIEWGSLKHLAEPATEEAQVAELTS